MNTQTRRKMIASFIFVILVCGVLFDHVPDRTVILQGFSNTISSDARIDGSGIKYAIRGERFSEQTPIVVCFAALQEIPDIYREHRLF